MTAAVQGGQEVAVEAPVGAAAAAATIARPGRDVLLGVEEVGGGAAAQRVARHAAPLGALRGAVGVGARVRRRGGGRVMGVVHRHAVLGGVLGRWVAAQGGVAAQGRVLGPRLAHRLAKTRGEGVVE